MKDKEKFIFKDLEKILKDKKYISKENKKKLNYDTKLVDLGMDSLDVCEFNLNVEVKFDIYIPEGNAEELNSLRDYIDYIKPQI